MPAGRGGKEGDTASGRGHHHGDAAGELCPGLGARAVARGGSWVGTVGSPSLLEGGGH